MGKRLIGSVGLKPGTDTGFDLDEKGQIHGYSDQQFALPVGDDNQVLTSLASEDSGLKWATLGSGDLEILNDSELGADGTTMTYTASTALNMDTTYGELVIRVQGWMATAGSVQLKINGNTTYHYTRIMNDSTVLSGSTLSSQSTFELINSAITTNADPIMALVSIKKFENGEGSIKFCIDSIGASTAQGQQMTDGYCTTTTADSEIDSIEILSTNNMDKGVRFLVWGRKL